MAAHWEYRGGLLTLVESNFCLNGDPDCEPGSYCGQCRDEMRGDDE